MTTTRVLGVVLAGGASSRMGRDKALVEVDGVAMARRVADALVAGGVDEVVLVGGEASWGSALGLGFVGDRYRGAGPLGGLATALVHGAGQGAEVVVVAPCDQPWLDANTVRALLAASLAGSAPVVARPVGGDGRAQPLPTVWPIGLVGPVDRALAAGERRLDAAFRVAAEAGFAVADVAVAEGSLRDVDRPSDLVGTAIAGVPAAEVQYNAPTRPAGSSTVDVPEIDIAEAARRHAAGTPVVDVREPDEYVEGHVPGAPLIPLGEVADRADEVPSDGEVLIICKAGGRSRKAAEVLRAQGIDAVNIAGGTMAWIEAGQRVVTGDEPGS